MKKDPMQQYAKATGQVPLMATMAQESRLREGNWLKNGCNSFRSRQPGSAPMSFWTEQDILQYLSVFHDEILEGIFNALKQEGFSEEEIRKMGIAHPWASCYGELKPFLPGEEMEGQIIIQEILGDYRDCKLRMTGCKRTGCIFCLFGITQDRERILQVQREEAKIADYVLRGGMFNENGIWQPSEEGLGFWFVIRWLCVHGKLRIPFDREKIYENTYGSSKTEELLVPD